MAPRLFINALTAQPLIPVPVKYSAFAQNAMWRGTTAPIMYSSATDRWFPSSTAPPVFGRCSRPSTGGRPGDAGSGGGWRVDQLGQVGGRRRRQPVDAVQPDRAGQLAVLYVPQGPLAALGPEREPFQHVGRHLHVGPQRRALHPDYDLLGTGRSQDLPRLVLREPLVDQRRSVLLTEQDHLTDPHPRDHVHPAVGHRDRVQQVTHPHPGPPEARLRQVRAAEHHRQRLMPDREGTQPTIDGPEHRVRLGHLDLLPGVTSHSAPPDPFFPPGVLYGVHWERLHMMWFGQDPY